MTDHSRADLLRFKLAGIDPEQLAIPVWFEKKPKPRETLVSIERSSSFIVKSEDTATAALVNTQRPSEYFWTLTHKEQKKPPELSKEDAPEDLADLINADAMTDEAIRESDKRPKKKPLVPWSRLWPVLQSALSLDIRSRRTDTDKLVRQISKGQWPNKIPVKNKKHWAAQAWVLVDLPDRLSPLNDDIHSLLEDLDKLRGGQGLTIQFVQDYPGHRVLEKQRFFKPKSSIDSPWESKPWRMPEPDIPLIIISDMGLYEASSPMFYRWIKLGKQLRASGIRPTVLAPVPEHWLPKELTDLYQCISWDTGSSLNPVRGRFPFDQIEEQLKQARQVMGFEKESEALNDNDQSHSEQSNAKTTENRVADTAADKARKEYQAYLSAAVEMDSHTLRAVRISLGKPLSVADEILLWNSDRTSNSSNLCFFHTQEHEYWRDLLVKQIRENPDKAAKIFHALRHTLQTQLSIDYFEALLFFKDCPELMADDIDLIKKAELYTNQFIQALAVEPSGTRHSEYKGIHYYSQRILNRQSNAIKQSDRRYSYWWSQWHKNHMGDKDKVAMPEWIDPSIFQAVNHQGNTKYNVELAIQGSDLVLSEGGAYQTQFSQNLDNQWEPIDQIETNYDQVIYSLSGRNKSQQEHLTLSPGFYKRFPLSRLKEQEYQFQIGDQSVGLASFKKPSWASSIQRRKNRANASVFLAGIENLAEYSITDNKFSIDVVISDNKAVSAQKKAVWHFLPKANKTDCLDDIGFDQYGLYADLNFFGVTQRFRWIEPGTFLMGSPEDEPERGDNEQQHPVTLTQGYWLADTCTTQELWQAVMGDNPSDFKGEQNPVDTVSWQDCWQFIHNLKEKHPALKITLPSEAQWEYACRAGTTTPFSFGEQINLDQVNFGDNYPYAEDNKDESRGKTVSVKSLPANPWGLYEMHGNLWEWCQDKGLRNYDNAVTDPGAYWLENPYGTQDQARPLRGGCYGSQGQSCYSSHRKQYKEDDRDGTVADYRYRTLGFRLSLGPEQLGGEAIKGPQAAVQAGEEKHDDFYGYLFNPIEEGKE